jgi:hypothetical protein
VRTHDAVLDVVIPVYNEETDLPGCVRRPHAHPESRVDIVATAVADLKGVARMLGGLAGGRIPVDRIRARLGRIPLAA